MTSLFADVRFALRRLRRSPGFVTIAVLMLSLGLGAATAIFAVVNSVLLRSPPLADPDRLVVVWEEDADEAAPRAPPGGGASPLLERAVEPALVYDLREHVEAFRDVAAYGRTGVTTVVDERGPEALTAAWVTGNFFELLGVDIQHGRGLRDDETWSDAPPTVVLSDRLWARRYGRDLDIVGKRILVDEVSREVVGVVASGAEFPDPEVDLWLPFGWSRAAVEASWFREERFVRAIARLETGVTVERAEAESRRLAESARDEGSASRASVHVGLTPLRDFLAADARLPLLVLLGSTALLLLMTCANLANLVLVRAGRRVPELALRTVLGAGRGRVARHLLVESLVLTMAGGLAGALVAVLGIRALRSLGTVGGFPLHEVPVDGRVLLFSLAVTIACGIVFGIAPALRGISGELATALREQGRPGGGRARRRATRTIVFIEVALSVLLVTGAGLLLRSFFALQRVDPGFRTEDRVAASVVLPARYESDTDIVRFVDEVAAGVLRHPDIRGLTYASRLPLSGTTVNPREITVEGRLASRFRGPVGVRLVGPGYFRVLGVPLLRGRVFEDYDRAGAEPVVIVNQEAARRLFPGEDPVDRRITWDPNPGPESTWYRIVGMVDDERQHGLRARPQAEVFQPFRQLPGAFVHFVVHAGPGVAVADAMRAELASVDPLLPLFEVRPLDDLYAATLGRDRFLLALISAFAALALLIGTLGVYGVTMEATMRRTHEIGVRVAVGASSHDVVALVVRHALGLAGAGIATGLLLALGVTRVLDSLLFGVASVDPLTFVIASLTILGGALLAALFPARRAMRVDPACALRAE